MQPSGAAGDELPGTRCASASRIDSSGSRSRPSTRPLRRTRAAGGVAMMAPRVPSRSAAFRLRCHSDALFFADWLEYHFDELRALSHRHGPQLQLNQLQRKVSDDEVGVRFVTTSTDTRRGTYSTDCARDALCVDRDRDGATSTAVPLRRNDSVRFPRMLGRAVCEVPRPRHWVAGTLWEDNRPTAAPCRTPARAARQRRCRYREGVSALRVAHCNEGSAIPGLFLVPDRSSITPTWIQPAPAAGFFLPAIIYWGRIAALFRLRRTPLPALASSRGRQTSAREPADQYKQFVQPASSSARKVRHAARIARQHHQRPTASPASTIVPFAPQPNATSSAALKRDWRGPGKRPGKLGLRIRFAADPACMRRIASARQQQHKRDKDDFRHHACLSTHDRRNATITPAHEPPIAPPYGTDIRKLSKHVASRDRYGDECLMEEAPRNAFRRGAPI